MLWSSGVRQTSLCICRRLCDVNRLPDILRLRGLLVQPDPLLRRRLPPPLDPAQSADDAGRRLHAACDGRCATPGRRRRGIGSGRATRCAEPGAEAPSIMRNLQRMRCPQLPAGLALSAVLTLSMHQDGISPAWLILLAGPGVATPRCRHKRHRRQPAVVRAPAPRGPGAPPGGRRRAPAAGRRLRRGPCAATARWSVRRHGPAEQPGGGPAAGGAAAEI